MKVKDIPENITQSTTVGEMLNLKCMYVLFDEMTATPFKSGVLQLIDERVADLLEMEV